MSHLFQRPLCDMGRAFDFAYRPIVGEPKETDGGGCDDRPRSVELFAARTDPVATEAVWRTFSVCPEHEGQLRAYDDLLRSRNIPPRFRSHPRPPSRAPRGR